MLRLIKLLAFTFVSASAATTAFGQAGYVHDLAGSATIQTKTGKPVALKVGDLVNAGQTITTADKSSAVVKFEDGQVMALHESTAFAVDGYHYDAKAPATSNAAFSLIKGGMRFITGVIGSTNRNSFRLAAGTATIGIRGTDGIVVMDALLVITAAVNAGAVALTTPLGSQTIGPGAFSTTSLTQPPAAPRPMSAAVGAVAAVLNTLAQKTGIPVNTPVVVRASARAAAATAAARQAQAAAAANPQNKVLAARAAQLDKTATALVAVAVQDAVKVFAAAIAAGAVAPQPAAISPTTTTAAVDAAAAAAKADAAAKAASDAAAAAAAADAASKAAADAAAATAAAAAAQAAAVAAAAATAAAAAIVQPTTTTTTATTTTPGPTGGGSTATSISSF